MQIQPTQSQIPAPWSVDFIISSILARRAETGHAVPVVARVGVFRVHPHRYNVAILIGTIRRLRSDLDAIVVQRILQTERRKKKTKEN